MNESHLIFVDCEGHGPAPTLNDETLFEFGAVVNKSKQSFHGQSVTKETFEKISQWLNQFPGRLIFVSDNLAAVGKSLPVWGRGLKHRLLKY